MGEPDLVRVLLLEADALAARSLACRIGRHHEVRTVGTIGALGTLMKEGAWRPEIIVTGLDLPDLSAVRGLERLHAAAGGVPVVLASGELPELLRLPPSAPRRHLLSATAGACPTVHQQPALHELLSAQHARLLADIEKTAIRAGEAVAERALGELSARLGLEDAEGVRLAVRLARGWEAAKSRFVSALATGIASAFLVALGAGIVAMMRSAQTR